MITIKRILCPIDSSPFSQRALRYAAALASWYDAGLIAHSVRSGLMPSARWIDAPLPLPLETPEERAAGERAVRAFVEKAVGDGPVEVVFSEGPVVDEILRLAREQTADLIVMGTHGVSGFERLLLGSVTERVLRKAPCPVLTVPREASPETVDADVTCRAIVCPVDFGEASQSALHYALSLAQEAQGRLVLMHVLEYFIEDEPRINAHFNVPEYRRALEHDARERLEAMIPEAARAWCEPEIVVGHGKAYREILRVAGERSADLIVLGVQGRGVIDRTLFGSTAEHVVRKATCPTLTVSSAYGKAEHA
ncbi:MAG: universal stress protein [Vicinamibacteraceae bacterium]|nr:universal stress protein [Vicinamibacteraceae bacterium]